MFGNIKCSFADNRAAFQTDSSCYSFYCHNQGTGGDRGVAPGGRLRPRLQVDALSRGVRGRLLRIAPHPRHQRQEDHQRRPPRHHRIWGQR